MRGLVENERVVLGRLGACTAALGASRARVASRAPRPSVGHVSVSGRRAAPKLHTTAPLNCASAHPPNLTGDSEQLDQLDAYLCISIIVICMATVYVQIEEISAYSLFSEPD